MKGFDRTHGMLAGASLALLLALLATIWSLGAPVKPVSAAPVKDLAAPGNDLSAPRQNLAAQLEAPKPVEGWYVCRNLGIGAVPGVPDLRQRLKLCHDSGWEVYAFCTQPGLPVPPVGRRCTRISGDTYQCGARNQRVREYRLLQTPVETATAAATPTAMLAIISTPAPTLAPTLAPIQLESLATPTHGYQVPTTVQSNARQLRVLLLTEICILLLAAILGAWIVWRVAKNRNPSAVEEDTYPEDSGY